MALKITNNATSVLAGAITASQTSFSIQGGDGSKFPTLGEEDWFPLVVVDAGGNFEVMKVTARATELLTVERAQEGTAASSFAAGCRCDLRLTAAAIQTFVQGVDALRVQNNLSDLADAAQAIVNLGLGSAALADIADFAAPAQGAKADTAVQPARKITVAGLAVGGGDFSEDRVISVPAATGAEVTTGTATDKAVTPKALADAGLLIPPGTLKKVTAFTASGTWNRTAGAVKALVYAFGSGGGGCGNQINYPTGGDGTATSGLGVTANGGTGSHWNSSTGFGTDGVGGTATGGAINVQGGAALASQQFGVVRGKGATDAGLDPSPAYHKGGDGGFVLALVDVSDIATANITIGIGGNTVGEPASPPGGNGYYVIFEFG